MLRKQSMCWERLMAVAVTVSLASATFFMVGCPGTVSVPPGNGDGTIDPGPTTDPVEFTNADGFKGGALFDKFYVTPGFDTTTADAAQIMAFGNFFRCKQCHAWDHLANTASYIDRAPKTTRPNVSPVSLVGLTEEDTAQQMFDEIKTGHVTRRPVSADLSGYNPDDPTTTAEGDRMPDFSEILSDAQIWDLVKYLREEFIDTTLMYDITTEGTYPTGSRTFSNIGKDGDAANGDALYTTKCAGCHDADGLQFLLDGDEFSIGSFARSKPNEIWHKIKFGVPGSPMGPQGINTVEEMNDILAALTNMDNYPDPPVQ